jgi:lipopolysaccharide export system protein LptC
MPHLRPFLAVVLVVVAAFSWWLAPPEDPASEYVSVSGQREIDHFITGLDVTRMSLSGQPADRLRAVELRHFMHDDTTELVQPHLTVFQDEAPPWEVDAESGWVSADGSLILLSGEVLIEREGDAGNRPMRLLTRELRVQPAEDYAETDEKVRVESEADWIDAVGMQAWLRPPSRLKFLSQVKGYHVPR